MWAPEKKTSPKAELWYGSTVLLRADTFLSASHLKCQLLLFCIPNTRYAWNIQLCHKVILYS